MMIRITPRLIIAFIVIFVFLPMVLGYFYSAYFNTLPEVVVPDVGGITFEEAQQKMEAVQLKARLAGSVYEMKYPEGKVVSQRPEAGRLVKAGRVVNLIISAGKKKVSVPNLLGRLFSQADALLIAKGLQVGEVRYEQNQKAEEGTILAQEPLPEEEVEIGSSVAFLVATTQEVRTNEND